MKNNLKAKIISTEKLIQIYEKMGYDVSIINVNKMSCLSLRNHNGDYIYLVYLSDCKEALTVDNVKDIQIDMSLDFSNNHRYLNYIIISMVGYENKSKYVKSKNLDISEIQKFNIRLEDSSYIEELLLLDEEDRLDEYVDMFAHNKIAYDAIKNSFESGSKKVCLSHATGTGKSIIISKCSCSFKGSNQLILSSSVYILNQIKSILSNTNNIEFMTYQKLAHLLTNDSEALDEFNPKLIVLDEFHRCGASQWGKGVDILLNKFPESNVLGLTATHIRYLDDCRDMSIELFDGNIVSTMSLYDAVARKVLPMPKYIVAFYDFKEKILDMEYKISKSSNSEVEKIKLRKKLDMLKDRNEGVDYISDVMKKYITNERNFIVFCKNIEQMREMQIMVPKWIKGAISSSVNVNTYELYSENNNSQQELSRYLQNIKQLDNNDFNLLFTIDMLNEGIHAEDIHGVILLRPTISPNVYYQQIGRAIHVSLDSNQPLIFDLVNNSESIQLHNFVEEIRDSTLNLPQEYISEDDKDFNPDMYMDLVIDNVYDETEDVLSMFKNMESILIFNWDEMYEKLKAYYEINGHTAVKDKDNLKLYYWCCNVSSEYKKGLLSSDRIEKLNAIDFIWSRVDYKWSSKFEELVKFKKIHGHTLVPKDFDVPLYNWVKKQRASYSKCELAKDKFEKLNALGMVWDYNDIAWKKQIKRLSEIRNELGHINISNINYFLNSKGERVEIDESLVNWLKTYKYRYTKNMLSDTKMKSLKELGIDEFIKSTRRDSVWDLRIKQLLEYKEIHGDLDIPDNYSNKSLRDWVVSNRVKYNRGELPNDRMKELDDLGFVWNAYEYRWDKTFNSFSELLSESEGDYSFLSNEDSSELNKWVKYQRRDRVQNKLSQLRIDKLNSINFVWSARDIAWEKGFRTFEIAVSIEGHGSILSNDKYPKERAWYYRQKKDASKLSKEKLDKLASLGYDLLGFRD